MPNSSGLSASNSSLTSVLPNDAGELHQVIRRDGRLCLGHQSPRTASVNLGKDLQLTITHNNALYFTTFAISYKTSYTTVSCDKSVKANMHISAAHIYLDIKKCK